MNFEHSTNFTILTKFNKIEPSKDLTNNFIHTLKLHNAHIKFGNSINLETTY
jgi:hypothetical protein